MKYFTFANIMDLDVETLVDRFFFLLTGVNTARIHDLQRIYGHSFGGENKNFNVCVHVPHT